MRWPKPNIHALGRVAKAVAAALLAGAVHANDRAEDVASFLARQPELYQQRMAYRRAVYALRTGHSREFQREAAKLEDYPLHIYLVYHAIQGRIAGIGARRARELRTEFADTPVAERFFHRWLNTQARQGRWDVYLANYEPTENTAARCNYLRALYRAGERTAALGQVRELWVAAKSQPKTCDPLFDVWIANGYLDQETVWARLTLALDANETTLARYLLRFFDRSNIAGRLYYDVHATPRIVRSLSRFRDDEGGRRALGHGLLRYAEDEPEKALALWSKVRESHSFRPADRRYIHEWLTVAAADGGQVPADAPDDFSPAAVEDIAGALVRHQRWPEAARWIRALPDDVAAKHRWQYWLGRALIDSGEDDAGRAQLAAIAGMRQYYGFLAAEDLGRTPALNAEAPRHDRRAQRLLLEQPGIRRMVELFAIGDLFYARLEWRYALSSLTPEQRRHLVELTAALGWMEQAIFGARDAEILDLVEIRFPMPHLDVFRRYAFDVNLPVQFLLAISRQESAFNPDAVSSAGARGLMQLMPATARTVAARVRLARPSREDLFDPHVNMRLGAHHLAALMHRYRGNRVLAAAAYNAGENRVARWRKDTSGMPTSVWIERIPFRETRDYVKGVLAFSHIYSRLLDNPAPVLAAHERVLP